MAKDNREYPLPSPRTAGCDPGSLPHDRRYSDKDRYLSRRRPRPLHPNDAVHSLMTPYQTTVTALFVLAPSGFVSDLAWRSGSTGTCLRCAITCAISSFVFRNLTSIELIGRLKSLYISCCIRLLVLGHWRRLGGTVANI